MGAQQVVPAVLVHQGRGLAVDGDVDGLVAGDPLARFGIQLDDADGAEIGAVRAPEASGGGIEQEGRVDGPAVFVIPRPGHEFGLGVAEVGGLGIQGLGPHGGDVAAGLALGAGIAGAVGHEVAVADLDDVRGHAAAGADGAVMPGPAVLRDEAAGACAESIVFSVALDDRGRVVDVDVADLGRSGNRIQGRQEEGDEVKSDLFHGERIIGW